MLTSQFSSLASNTKKNYGSMDASNVDLQKSGSLQTFRYLDQFAGNIQSTEHPTTTGSNHKAEALAFYTNYSFKGDDGTSVRL